MPGNAIPKTSSIPARAAPPPRTSPPPNSTANASSGRRRTSDSRLMPQSRAGQESVNQRRWLVGGCVSSAARNGAPAKPDHSDQRDADPTRSPEDVIGGDQIGLAGDGARQGRTRARLRQTE